MGVELVVARQDSDVLSHLKVFGTDGAAGWLSSPCPVSVTAEEFRVDLDVSPLGRRDPGAAAAPVTESGCLSSTDRCVAAS